MLTLMPRTREKDPYLRILSEDLANVPVSAILANLKKRDVTLHLPKFTIENSLNLMPALQRVSVIRKIVLLALQAGCIYLTSCNV